MSGLRPLDAKHWRSRAAEVRKMADEVGGDLRATILEIAEHYERMARETEERDAGRRSDC